MIKEVRVNYDPETFEITLFTHPDLIKGFHAGLQGFNLLSQQYKDAVLQLLTMGYNQKVEEPIFDSGIIRFIKSEEPAAPRSDEQE